MILTEYILDKIQGVDAPDIVARRPFVMRDYPCAARLRRSGAAVGQGRPTRHGRRAHHVFFVSVLADDGRDIIIYKREKKRGDVCDFHNTAAIC